MRYARFLPGLIFLSVLFMGCDLLKQPQTSVAELRCEYAIDPHNIDNPAPRFSWIIESEIRGQRQTAYQIHVSKNKTELGKKLKLLWDSGRVESAGATHIEYRGAPLASNSHYFWHVIIWDKDGLPHESRIAEFETAQFSPDDWSAKWIGSGPQKEPRSDHGFFKNPKEQYACEDTVVHDGRSVLLRREISCKESIKRARVFVTGLGFYEFYLNGAKVGDHVQAPAKTNYRKQVLYDTYDVTAQLKKGVNALGIHLGNGWFNPYKKWWRPYRMQWFGAKRAFMQLHVEYQNGATEIFTTDEHWKFAPGPILFNCIYDGEIYDANEEHYGWNAPGFDDSHWKKVNIVEPPGGKLISHVMPAIKVTQEIEPVKMHNPAPGVQVFDLGQNFAGWVRLRMKGEKGTKVQLRFAEDIFADGNIDVTSNEHAKATATYILKGGTSETYEPRFTYFGFKYVEITAEPKLPEIEKVTGCVVHSACEQTGIFECGNDVINKIHRATVWSQRSNMLGFPMDCPQRDERLGWFGDAQVTAEEAIFNFDMPLFYKNWLSGIQSNQDDKTGDIPIISPRPYIWDEGVEWSSTYIVMNWLYYLHYGDTRILEEHFESMERYVQFLDSISSEYILKPGWIGDWGSLVKGWKEGEPVSVPTAFYYWNSTILSKVADVLGKTSEAVAYKALASNIRDAYNRKFFNASTKQYNDGSQMANAFPLFLGIVPEKYRQEVLDNLVADIVEKNDGHLTTGVLGSKYMIEALSLFDRADIGWLLATQTGYPSWSDMVQKYTTMSEFWTLKQSHNHVMTGSIDAFFFKTLAGIHVDEANPGFKKIIIKPFIPDSLDYVKASIKTIRGTIASEWQQTDTELRFNLTIPANSSADVFFPVSGVEKIYENGVKASESEGITHLRSQANFEVFSLASGNYNFTVMKEPNIF